MVGVMPVRGGGYFQIARATINGPALRRIKWHRRHRLTAGTFSRNLDPLTDARLLGTLDRGESLILQLFAGFTAFRRVCELLIAEKGLFARCPDKIVVTIDTEDLNVREFGFGLRNTIGGV